MSEKRYYYDRALDKIKNRETGDDYWFLCDIADLLNKQDKKIKEFETVIQQILYETRANYTKGEYSIIVSVSPQMHDKLSNLIRKRMW